MNDDGRLVFVAGLAESLPGSQVVLAADVPLSSPATGDADGDGNVDADDLQAFAVAMTPVDAIPEMPPSDDFLDSAETFDFDSDGDLDLTDYCNLTLRASF